MADLTAFLLAKSKLDALMEQFEALEKAKKYLEEQDVLLREDWSAWYHIYKKEKPVEEQPFTASVEESPEQPQTILPGIEPPPDSVIAMEKKFSPKSYGEKTAAVTRLLAEAGEQGMFPKEITAALRDSGLKVSDSFAGNALHRLRKKGMVRVLESGASVLISREEKPEIPLDAA